MRTLNKAAAEAIAQRIDGVHACTDITGFGLIGHAMEMAAASGVTIAIERPRSRHSTGVLEMVSRNRSGGMATNREHFGAGVEFGDGVPATSGPASSIRRRRRPAHRRRRHDAAARAMSRSRTPVRANCRDRGNSGRRQIRSIN